MSLMLQLKLTHSPVKFVFFYFKKYRAGASSMRGHLQFLTKGFNVISYRTSTVRTVRNDYLSAAFVSLLKRPP